MPITADVQQLEPGALIELFEVDCTAIGGDMLRFHGHLQSASIWWQDNEYKPWPIQATGFMRTTDAQQPSPTLTVGDINGTISALCVYLDDLVGATVRRRRTLARYLDAANFLTDITVENQQFGAGDGATKAFQLVGPNGQPVNQAIDVQSIYRTDWQGRQLLYATPRTNLLQQSGNFASWGNFGGAPTGSVTGPDGVSTAEVFVESTDTGDHFTQRSDAVIVSGSMNTLSVLAAQAGRRYLQLGLDDGGGLNGIYATFDLQTGVVTQALTFGTGVVVGTSIEELPAAGWYQVSVSGSFAEVTAVRTFLLLSELPTAGVAPVYTGDGVSGVALFDAQLEPGSVATSRILTTTAPVTVTDYVLGATGEVALASAPVEGAVLEWTGTGKSAGNPTADPTAEMVAEIWRVEQKSNEQPGLQVEFTLASPLDFGGQQLPARQIVNICQWKYRDANCGYTGSVYFDANDQPVSDPALDRCSMRTSGCECRFGTNNPLPFGGFLSDTLS